MIVPVLPPNTPNTDFALGNKIATMQLLPKKKAVIKRFVNLVIVLIYNRSQLFYRAGFTLNGIAKNKVIIIANLLIVKTVLD